MTKRLALCSRIALLSLACTVADAHHAVTMYNMDRPITIEGVVKSFEWTNPQVIVRVVANHEADQPEKTWAILATSPGNLTRVGWTRHTFKSGDRVRMVIGPLRNGDPGGGFVRATLLDTGQEVSEIASAAANSTSNLK